MPTFTAFLTIVVSGTLACSPATMDQPVTLTPQLHAELIAARDTVWQAWFSGDSALLVRLLPDPMVGMEKPRDAIIAEGVAFRRSGGTLVSLTFVDDEFVVRNGMALVLSVYQAVTSTAGVMDTLHGRATEIFVRDNGQWLNPYWHLHE